MAFTISFNELPTTVRDQLHLTDEPVIVVENSRPVAGSARYPTQADFRRVPGLIVENWLTT